MIIGYYEQIFFGGGKYYKLSKKNEEKEYKIEYSHSAVPNYIPEAEKYIKKYDTLKIEDERKKEYFEGKIKVNYISNNAEIESLLEYILTCNWEDISKKDYNNSDILDGLNWYFFIEINGKKYEIDGYEEFPKEITYIIEKLKNISDKYLEEIMPNKKDIENIMRHKKSNISFMKFLYKKKRI